MIELSNKFKIVNKVMNGLYCKMFAELNIQRKEERNFCQVISEQIYLLLESILSEYSISSS